MSLNMNDVSDLTITEGDVRTIHDSSDRLLWGKLSYNTYYAGDTKQQTYSGKNLFYGTNVVNEGITSTWNGSNVSLSGTTTTSYANIIYANSITTTFPAGTYTFSTDSVTSVYSKILRINYDGANHDYSIVKGSTSVTFTTPSNFNIRICFISGLTSGIQISDTFGLQLEAGSTPTEYEPYVGGIPAPNPDYPQAVNVVTGEQTITINDEDFTLNLGTTELCKIGDYQDYLYKSGDDWYLHKETTKILGSQATWGNNGTNEKYTQGVITVTDVSPSISLSDFCNMYCANLLASGDAAKTQTVSPTTTYRCGGTTSSGYIRVNIGVSYAPDWTSFTNIIQNLVLYYPLATPTDTKITDTTLITQLNDINEWLTRYGYNSIVSGNLPLIIIQNNL